MVIMNYEERYNEILENGFGKFPNTRDMQIVCMLERKKGKTEDEIVSLLSNMCENEEKVSSFRVILKKISKVSRETQKNLKELQPEIVFTKKEINSIKSLKNYDEQKLLYILMCICKVYGTDSVFLNSKSPVKLKEVLSMAKISVSVRKGEDMLHSLFVGGLVSVLPNLKYTMNCLDEERNDIAFVAKSSLNVVEDFDVYNGLGIRCLSCGKYVKRRSNNTKYCGECAKKAKAECDKKRVKKTKVEKV